MVDSVEIVEAWWPHVSLVSMHLFPGWAVQARALIGDIVLCSWARHLTLTVPLSTKVYL